MGGFMKVLSLMQPWATLIALGEKHFETRSWNTRHRGDLAIHASQRIDRAVCRVNPIAAVLAQHGYTPENLPAGAIVATCRLILTYRVVETGDEAALVIATTDRQFKPALRIVGNEWHFGDYRIGRFAWELADATPIAPIVAKGRLGLWEYPLAAVTAP